MTWDLMQPQPITLGGVIDQFRWSFGTAGLPRITLPAFLLDLGARARRSRQPARLDAADAHRPRSPNCAAASPAIPRAGWRRPASCRRRWRRWSARAPATIQDKWFARLFLVKALVIASLALFWTVSGFIALVVSYRRRGRYFELARLSGRRWSRPVTILTSLMDMSIGVLIAFRRTARVRPDRRHRGVAGLYGGRGDPDARTSGSSRSARWSRPGPRSCLMLVRATDAG